MLDWFTETCPSCGCMNHVPFNNPYAIAWECWSCFSKFFLDSDIEWAYNRDDLNHIPCLHGQTEYDSA